VFGRRTLWLVRSVFVIVSLTLAGGEAGAAASATARKQATTRSSSVKKSTAKKNLRARTTGRAARAARALREASTPHYRVDSQTGSVVPDLQAAAAIIYDPHTGEVFWQENAQDQRSIASITKVMTAIVFLEGRPDLNREVLVSREELRGASTTYLKANDRVRAIDLLHLLLIPSDNGAARALASTYPGGLPAFVERMNQKADDLDLESTAFADPSGLLSDNVSSAYDMAKLITFASSMPMISSIMRRPEYSFQTVGNRTITVHSTNQILRQGDIDVVGGKTGFISKAGYCLATLLRLPEGGPEVAVVVLGARSNLGRFWETRHLFNWFTENAQTLFSTSLQKDN
jgi:serine-type D-Ala-D-Ala endopeptidase (penicillin-binding protein 7)